MFTIFVVIVQVLQFLLVYSIAWLNNRTIEFLFIFFSFQMNRMVFGKSYHADSLSKCTLITLVTFYLLIKGVHICYVVGSDARPGQKINEGTLYFRTNKIIMRVGE